MMRSADPGGLAAWFGECYGQPPELIWHAPGRVNLIGEHTDYNDGLVLPFALGLGVLAAAAAGPDGMLELRSRQMPDELITIRLDQLAPGALTGWPAYVAGPAWALLAGGYPLAGARVAIDSDLPIGAGLASSAAVECAVICCLAALTDAPGPSRSELAALARRAETDFVGMPCGIMDQSAAMLCRAGHALLLDCRTGDSSAVPLNPAAAGLRILVADTGVRHSLADGQYAARRRECEEAAGLLGVASLRAVTDTGAPTSLRDRVLAARARHVITENLRVAQVARLLQEGRLADCGELLTQSHVSLRDDFEVSWPAADVAVDAAIAAGAFGARMTGGGFGGCVIALLPADRTAAVSTGVRAALSGHTRAGPAFHDGDPAAGATQVWPA